MRDGYLHRWREQSFAIRAYALSAVGIDVVSVHKLFANRVVCTVSTYIVSSHTYEILQNRILYDKIAECIARSDQNQNQNCLLVIRPRTIIHQNLWLGELVPSPHKRSKLSN